jgi:hypothetical protein
MNIQIGHAPKPPGVHPVHRIVAHIGVKVHAVAIADGVGLQEPAEGGGVGPGLVVVEAEFGDPRLAGVLEPAGVGGAGDAIFIIAVDDGGAAGAVGDGDDRAALIGVQPAAIGGASL